MRISIVQSPTTGRYAPEGIPIDLINKASVIPYGIHLDNLPLNFCQPQRRRGLRGHVVDMFFPKIFKKIPYGMAKQQQN